MVRPPIIGAMNPADPTVRQRESADGIVAAPRAAYVHVPFCRHRCGYCNFTVVAGRDELIEPYLEALAIELRGLSRPRPVDTLFFGGGTPTHLPPKALGRLLELVSAWFPLQAGGEWSVEANPVDVTPERADLLATAGVTRLSLGVQSFAAEKLATLERDHRRPEIERAVEIARAHFRSLSIDLIYGSPGETLSNWEADLTSALDLPIDHLSVYGLTYERGARFWSLRQHGRLRPLDEQTEAAMYLSAIERAEAAGFKHYEVSNFARRGHVCRHNEVYWTGQPYYGVGPGAASYIDGVRSVNHRSTSTYLKRVFRGESPIAERERLDAEDRARETLVFGLRRLEGVDRDAFAQQTGLTIEALVAEPLEWMLQRGLLQWHDNRLRLTRRGLLVSDSIWPYFLRT